MNNHDRNVSELSVTNTITLCNNLSKNNHVILQLIFKLSTIHTEMRMHKCVFEFRGEQIIRRRWQYMLISWSGSPFNTTQYVHDLSVRTHVRPSVCPFVRPHLSGTSHYKTTRGINKKVCRQIELITLKCSAQEP